MNPRVEVERAFRREACERPPCFPLVDVCFASRFHRQPLGRVQRDPSLHAQALTRCVQELPIAGVYVNLCLNHVQAAACQPREGAHHVRLDDALDVTLPEDDVLSIAHSDLQALDDPRIETAALFHPGMRETFEQIPADVRGRAAVCVGLTGAFSQLAFLLGLEPLLLATIDRPGEVHGALRRRQGVALQQATELRQAGAEFIWVGEGMASSALISPAMYREFVLPYERELAAHLRRLGARSILHICGNITPALGAIATAGCDAVDVDWPTDWAAAVDRLGPVTCLKGNLDPLLFLPGNETALEDACRETRRVAAVAPGFILSTGCLVPRDADPRAFLRAAEACTQP